MREAVDGSTGEPIKTWRLTGPPGGREARERIEVAIDPARFAPGKAYLIEAAARDFRPPAGQWGRSSPIVWRVRHPDDLRLPAGDARAAAFAALKQAIADEQRARAVAGNVAVNLDDLRRHGSVAGQLSAVVAAQAAAGETAKRALGLFTAAKDDATLASLRPLVEGAMGDVLGQAVALKDGAGLGGGLATLTGRQDDLIARLVALLGRIAEQARPPEQRPSGDAGHEADRARVEALKDDLDRFIRDQERIIERSKSLADGGPADLTRDEQQILGELAREESAWAKFLEEKLTDFSKLPPQDFSDPSQSGEFNVVWQDIKAAANALDGKNIELAVPREQSGLELAKTLENNLEKWLSDTPDKIKWSMEEAQAPADVPVAELPKELEDIVGELMDQEEAMTDDVQDASSAWMDSIDKGAGWTAADGPISNMSAKGITGNVLPNQSEIGGRSGEGRNGRSSGQMVQDEAVGKGGQETPTRLTPSPFEQGSVKDSSTDDRGGATGGGKNSGFAQEGLRGPTPPPQLVQAMQRLSGKQAQIRQQAEAVQLQLKARHLPTGDLETAITAMRDVEAAARSGQAQAIRARHSQAVDALGDARGAIAGEARLQRERSHLPEQFRGQLMSGSAEGIPPGYEDMVGAYFRALAGVEDK
jgi:hypothetical protein